MEACAEAAKVASIQQVRMGKTGGSLFLTLYYGWSIRRLLRLERFLVLLTSTNRYESVPHEFSINSQHYPQLILRLDNKYEPQFYYSDE